MEGCWARPVHPVVYDADAVVDNADMSDFVPGSESEMDSDDVDVDDSDADDDASD